MWAPTVSSTTSGARYLVAFSVAELSPVRRAFRYASTARTRGFIALAPFFLRLRYQPGGGLLIWRAQARSSAGIASARPTSPRTDSAAAPGRLAAAQEHN